MEKLRKEMTALGFRVETIRPALHLFYPDRHGNLEKRESHEDRQHPGIIVISKTYRPSVGSLSATKFGKFLSKLNRVRNLSALPEYRKLMDALEGYASRKKIDSALEYWFDAGEDGAGRKIDVSLHFRPTDAQVRVIRNRS